MKFKLPFGFLKLKKTRSLDEWRRVNQGMNPLRDWTIGVVASVIVFIAGVSYTSYDFITQIQATTVTVSGESKPVLYHDKEVVQFAKAYDEKELIFNELRKVVAEIPKSEQVAHATTTTPVAPQPKGKPVAD